MQDAVLAKTQAVLRLYQARGLKRYHKHVIIITLVSTALNFILSFVFFDLLVLQTGNIEMSYVASDINHSAIFFSLAAFLTLIPPILGTRLLLFIFYGYLCITFYSRYVFGNFSPEFLHVHDLAVLLNVTWITVLALLVIPILRFQKFTSLELKLFTLVGLILGVVALASKIVAMNYELAEGMDRIFIAFASMALAVAIAKLLYEMLVEI